MPPWLSPCYLAMLLPFEAVPRLHDVLACVFSFVLLVGFVVIPGVFSMPVSAAEANKAVALVGFRYVGCWGVCCFCLFGRPSLAIVLAIVVHFLPPPLLPRPFSSPFHFSLSLFPSPIFLSPPWNHSPLCSIGGADLVSKLTTAESQLVRNSVASKLRLGYQQSLSPAAARRAGRGDHVAAAGELSLITWKRGRQAGQTWKEEVGWRRGYGSCADLFLCFRYSGFQLHFLNDIPGIA